MTVSVADCPSLIELVALKLLDNPSGQTAREFRFGRSGSLPIRLGNGTWFDHEASKGGGVLDLVRRDLGSRRLRRRQPGHLYLS